MARKLRYPHSYFVRLNDEAAEKLRLFAETRGVTPTHALRILAEKALKVKKGDK